MDPVVHWEIYTNDAQSLAAFYARLFGWRTRLVPEISYVLIDTCAGAGINGGIATSPDSRLVTFYIRSVNLEATLDRIETAGGKTTLQPVTEDVTFAQFADPAGNVIGLLKAGDETAVSEGSAPGVTGFEIATPDPAGLFDFYARVFGWRSSRRIGGDVVVETGGIPGLFYAADGRGAGVRFAVSVDRPDQYAERASGVGELRDLENAFVLKGIADRSRTRSDA